MFNGLSENPALPNAPSAMPTPAEFAASSVMNIAGALAGPLAALAVLGITAVGAKMIITGKNPLRKNVA